MARHITGIGSILCGLSLGWASAAGAAIVTVDYDGAKPKDLVTAPYLEKGITTTVNAGHYDFYADATGADGDQAFNIDDHQTGPSSVTITAEGGQMFDVVSMDVINPADPATGESYTISAIGGGGGSMPAPTTTGPVTFGPGFHGITALVITQDPGGSATGAFAFDDLTIQSLPEPSAAASLVAGALAAAALRRRRAR